MTKKILFIATYFAIGGPNTVLIDLARFLKNSGYDISVLYPKTHSVHQRLSKEGINVVINSEIFQEEEKPLEFFKQFQLIILNGGRSHNFLKPIKKIGIPIIWINHVSHREVLERQKINEFHLSLPEKVIFVSDFSREIFSDLQTQNNFLTIHNGIDVQKLENFIQENNKRKIRDKFGFSENDIVITTIGRFKEFQGQKIFVEAAKILLKSNSYNLRFLIVGFGPKEEEQKIQTLITKHNLQSKVSLITRPKNINEIYLLSDIFVTCSFRESFPCVILEAMVFDLPIIATNVGGIPEQIEDGINGFLINPGDPIKLSKKIECLLNNSKTKENFVKINKRRVRELFNIKKSGISYRDIIEELC